MPGHSKLPPSLKRSPVKAQRTWAKAHDSAVASYGEGPRAHRTAFAALKHAFKRSDDRWVPKDSKGPSDPRAKQRADGAREGRGQTFGGLDYYGSSKDELYERAKDLHIKGRSSMNKKQLAEAIAKRQ